MQLRREKSRGESEKKLKSENRANRADPGRSGWRLG